MKKTLLVALLIAVTCFCVFANGNKEAEEEGPVTLTVLTSVITQTPEGPLYEEYFKEFEETHPDIKLELSGISFNQSLQKVTTLAAAGALPDLFVTSESTIGKFYDMGITADFAPYLSEEDVANLSEGSFGIMYAGDQMIMFPLYNSPNALLYRVDWLEELGLDVPENLDEVLEVAKAFTTDIDGDGNIDRYGFGLIGTNDDSGAIRFIMIHRAFGARELYYEDGEWKTEVGSPESIAAFEYFRNLKTKYNVAPPGCLENSFNENVNLMAMEQIGLLIAGSNSTGKIFAANPDLRGKIGSVEMPKQVTSYTPTGTVGWAMNPDCKHKEEAVEFVKFLISKEKGIRTVEVTGRTPVTKDAIAESEYMKSDLMKGFADASSHFITPPDAPFYAEVKTELGKTYQSLILDPSLDVTTAVKACREAIDRIIANNT